MKKILSFLIISSFSFCVVAQVTDLSLELQAYPTGIISGIQFERSLGAHDAIHLRLGYQFIRHADQGVHEDERGDGYGFTIGYKRYFKEEYKDWFLSLRTDVWFNTLDWRDNIEEVNEVAGTSKITVLQPTLQLGFHQHLSKNMFLIPTVAFGYEVNVKTEGAAVGEGAILLLGFQLGKRF
jgi:hypothetical protein